MVHIVLAAAGQARAQLRPCRALPVSQWWHLPQDDHAATGTGASMGCKQHDQYETCSDAHFHKKTSCALWASKGRVSTRRVPGPHIILLRYSIDGRPCSAIEPDLRACGRLQSSWEMRCMSSCACCTASWTSTNKCSRPVGYNVQSQSRTAYGNICTADCYLKLIVNEPY